MLVHYWESPGKISHIEMCRSNGVKRFKGTLKGSFGCSCGEGSCGEGHDGLVFFDIEGHDPDDALLLCKGDKISDASRNDVALGVRRGSEEDKKDLKEIIIAELTKTANHGAIFIF